jgi:peptidoglycan L-alanyl-D-glutamate endopeptidase CwlK
MPLFSDRSRAELDTCHPNLRMIALEAIQTYDFSVIHGHRTETQQNKLFPKYTKVKWPNSKHNSQPSMAIDVVPYVKGIGGLTGSPKQISDLVLEWNVSRAKVEQELWWSYGRLHQLFIHIAQAHCIAIRGGADWDQDGRLLDERFIDAGHFELL